MESRKILLEGADNARELGGLAAGTGAKIKRKRLLRSNQLARLTEKDISILKEDYGLVKIIDLRTEAEVKEAGDVTIPGAEWIHLPVFTEQMIGITHESGADQGLAGAITEMPKMEDLYRMMVSDSFCQGQFAKVFEVISKNENGAVLWHCTEGKDRCGMVSALLEFCLDVGVSNIFEDYLLTNEASEKRSRTMYQNVFEKTGNAQAAESAATMFLAKREYLAAAVCEMERISGSVDRFLEEHCGITEAVKRKMRENYLQTG